MSSIISISGSHAYRCDILCRDELSGKTVLVENQLEPTNHEHLGKIITYASGLDAAVVVWIVSSACEEHASAIEWLNKHTDDSVSFFLIEIHAYTIGDSDPAPQFKIIEQPNDFAKMVKTIARSSELSDAEAKRLEFWTIFNEVLEQHGKPFNKRKATTDHWYDVAVGSSLCHISICLVNKEHLVRVCFDIPNSKDLFDKLIIDKNEIESVFGEKLDWDRMEGKKACCISTRIASLDFNKQENYPEHMNQIIDTVLRMKSRKSDARFFKDNIIFPCICKAKTIDNNVNL